MIILQPVLMELHWLPVEARIHYKIAVLVFKSLNQSAPKYLQEIVTPYNSLQIPARWSSVRKQPHYQEMEREVRSGAETGLLHLEQVKFGIVYH